MMKPKYVLGILVCLSLILGSNPTPPATAQAPAGSHLRVVSSDSQGVVLELTVDGFEVETVEHEGRTFQRLVIPDMVHTQAPGEPQVPTRGTLLGLPSSEGVSVQVLEADYDTLSGYLLHPAPRLELIGNDGDDMPVEGVREAFALNQDTYATNAFYPGPLLEIGYTGYLRDQAVAQVGFYPAQYNPVSGQVRLYRRILARVTSDTPLSVTAAEGRGASPAYEKLLRNTLLNYDALTRPPVIDKSPPPSTGGDVIALDTSPALKIGVTEDGLYQLNRDDLTNAGFELSGVLLSRIKIKNRGAEIPIYVHDENGDDAFDDGDDYILFYGAAIDDMYTTQNVYWLEAGDGAGQRMGTRDGTPSGGTVPYDFPVTLHAEEDTYYWNNMPGAESEDRWFWGSKLSAPETRDFALSLNNISTTASNAVVRVRLKGRSIPTHHSKLYLNSPEIDYQTWDGQLNYDHAVTITHSTLNEGGNTLRVEALNIGLNQFFVNWIELDYWDTYVAENDQLLFGAPQAGAFQFEVTGFTTGNDLRVFDVTDPGDVTRIINADAVSHGGGYKLRFRDTAQPESRYLALAPAQYKSPASIELDEPSSWRSTDKGADYILITHEDFSTEAQRLADHRGASGLRVVTVKVEDIYDEFNHGIFNPQAIRDFLSYAYDYWVAPAPTYVLLLGDGHYDYRGNTNYVPTKIIVTPSTPQAASDNWFVLLNGSDVLPEMFIGRLAAYSTSQMSRIVDKIIYYDQHPPGNDWNKNVLLVADDGSSSDGYTDAFEITSEQLADRLPPYYTANKIYVRHYSGVPATDITDYIDNGSVLVNYAGHGNTTTWGATPSGGLIYTTSDVGYLDGTHRLPVVTMADCYNGYFIGDSDSMAERFQRATDKAAVAVWAATGLGYPSGHRALLTSFYEEIFEDDADTLGRATTQAKIAAYNQNPFSLGELVEIFVLFGDPAQESHIPNYPVVESTTPPNGATNVSFDQDVQIVFSKSMNPATVQLSGSGTSGLGTPSWNADYTVLTYDQNQFNDGETLNFTIEGQDSTGNDLGPGPAPNPWSFTTIYVRPRDVTIIGPTKGITQTAYSFTANVSPDTVVQSITYEWQATDQTPVTYTGGGLSDTISFTWWLTGTQTVTVTVTNAYGTASDDHIITISDDTANNAVYLPIVVKGN